MTVSNQTNRTSADSTGAEQIIPFTFPITANSDIVVTQRDQTTGDETPLAETTNYTVVNNGSSGGSITTVTPFPTASDEIHIVRDTPNTQITDLQPGGAFNADNVEGMADKNAKLTIENAELLGNTPDTLTAPRVMRFPATDPLASFAMMPNAIDRAGKFLAFDVNGKPTASSTVAGTDVTHSAYGVTVAGTANAASNRTLLGLAITDDVEFAQITGTTGIFDDVQSKSPVADIRAFDADDTGATESTTAITAAIAAANADGIVYIPDGTFLIDSQIDINKSITFVGNGKSSILKSGFAGDMFNVSAGTNVIGLNFKVDGDSTGTFMTVAAPLALLRMEKVTFINTALDYNINAASGIDVDRIEIIGCTMKDCLNGMRFAGECVSAYVGHNLIDTLTGTSEVQGFQLGHNTFAMQDAMQRYIVTNNVFLNITTTGVDSEAHAVIAYGREAIYTDNIVDTVTNHLSSDQGAEALYTKCRFNTITGNEIIDGGRSNNGVITIKGSNRGVETSPQGFATIVSNNIILESSVQTDVGIFITNDDCLVIDNYMEGLSGVAIRTAELQMDNVTIRGNKIVRHKGVRPIRINSWGSGLRINDNQITDMLLTETGIGVTLAMAIVLEPDNGNLTDVQINNNYIKDNGSAPSTADLRGIRIESLAAAGRIQGLEIKDNKIFLTSATEDVYGISMDVTNGTAPSLTKFVCTGNDFVGLVGHDADGTRPLFISGTAEAADIEITKLRDNIFKGPQQDKAASFNIEFEDSGDTFTNIGQAGAITGSLPVAQVGLIYSAVAIEDADFLLDPDGTDLIIGSGGAGNTLSLDTLGDSVTLECLLVNTWSIVAGHGTYTFA